MGAYARAKFLDSRGTLKLIIDKIWKDLITGLRQVFRNSAPRNSCEGRDDHSRQLLRACASMRGSQRMLGNCCGCMAAPWLRSNAAFTPGSLPVRYPRDVSARSTETQTKILVRETCCTAVSTRGSTRGFQCRKPLHVPGNCCGEQTYMLSWPHPGFAAMLFSFLIFYLVLPKRCPCTNTEAVTKICVRETCCVAASTCWSTRKSPSVRKAIMKENCCVVVAGQMQENSWARMAAPWLRSHGAFTPTPAQMLVYLHKGMSQ